MEARISRSTPESMPEDNAAPLSDYEQGVLADMEEQAFLDEERERIVGLPSETDYINALDQNDASPSKRWQEARQLNRVSREDSSDPVDQIPPIDLPTPDELVARQRFVEFTRHHEELVRRERETRQEARQFAIEQPPKGRRGLLERFKDVFRGRGASYAKVPPLPTGMGIAAFVNVSILPVEYEIRQ